MYWPEAGWVYVLTNPAMPGIVKIGHGLPSKRARELSGPTGIPMPFSVAYQLEVTSPREVEKRAHKKLDRYRVSRNREFFSVSVEMAAETLEKVARPFLPDDQYRRLLVGRSYDTYYKEHFGRVVRGEQSLNWTAGFLSVFWLLYRKQNRRAFLAFGMLIALHLIISLTAPERDVSALTARGVAIFSLLAGVFFFPFMLLSSNRAYLKFIERRLTARRSLFRDPSAHYTLAEGPSTSVPHALLFGVLMVVSAPYVSSRILTARPLWATSWNVLVAQVFKGSVQFSSVAVVEKPSSTESRQKVMESPVASFDCSANGLSSIERVICDDGELRALDVKMAEQYRRARADGRTSVAVQRAWLATRAECHRSIVVIDCLRTLYLRRIGEL